MSLEGVRTCREKAGIEKCAQRISDHISTMRRAATLFLDLNLEGVESEMFGREMTIKYS